MSNLTKGVIEDVSDLEGDGFIVWATWTKDKDDNSIFTNNYADGFYENVFGDGGTKVIRTQGVWKYSPPKYWHRGIYTFAAVLPASTFNATYSDYTPAELTNPYGTYTGGVVTNEDNTLSYNPSVITLHLGEEGYDLSAEQDDIMVAYYNVDNRSENAPQTTNGVSLNFKHQMSQIAIEAANIDENIDITILQIEVSGNHRSIVGDLVFTPSENNVTANYELNDSTSLEAPYQIINTPSDPNNSKYDWVMTKKVSDAELEYDTIVPSLLVFPEECYLSFKVIYTASIPSIHGTTSQPIEGTVTTSRAVKWRPGVKYAYRLQISGQRVDIVSSSIKEWEWEWEDKDIEHEFN